VQRTADGHTCRVLIGWMIRRSGDAMSGLYHARGASKPRSTVCQWFGLKTTGTAFSHLASKPVVTVFSGLASKPLGRYSPVWPQNQW
jgi:hypothetical protein